MSHCLVVVLGIEGKSGRENQLFRGSWNGVFRNDLAVANIQIETDAFVKLFFFRISG